jgi:hypothetical protein
MAAGRGGEQNGKHIDEIMKYNNCEKIFIEFSILLKNPL